MILLQPPLTPLLRKEGIKGNVKNQQNTEVLKVQFQIPPYTIAEVEVRCAIRPAGKTYALDGFNFILDLLSLQDWLPDR